MRFRFADCMVDVGLFELWRGDERVEVQPKVLTLLIFLLENRHRTVSKEEILDAVWPGTATSEGSLTRAIRFVRVAIGDEQRSDGSIRTVRGRGYRFSVEVAVDTEDEEPAATSEPPSDFLCRSQELNLAKGALAQTLAGRGRVLLLVGQPGMGKTRLAQELANVAERRGAEVLWGHCRQSDGGPTFWPWIQILRSLLRRRGIDDLVALLGPSGASTIAEIVPEVRERLPDLPAARERAPERAQFHLFDTVATLLRLGAEERPLMLVLDDLHGADEPSLMLLRFIGHELVRERILVVGTYRDVEISPRHPLSLTLAELARAQRPRQTIFLRGLTEACVRRFVEQFANLDASQELVDGILERTEGNPLFLVELLHWIRARNVVPGEALDIKKLGIPEGIRQAIEGRLSALPDACRQALSGASVIGRDFSLSLLAQACGVSEDSALERLEEAELAQVISRSEEGPGRFRFSHPLVAEVLYDELPTGARARIHRRIAEALEARYKPRPIAATDLQLSVRGSHLAELAHHFVEAAVGADVEKALDYSTRAADHAMTILAHEDAVRHYERALQLLEASAEPGDSRLGPLRDALARAEKRSEKP